MYKKPPPHFNMKWVFLILSFKRDITRLSRSFTPLHDISMSSNFCPVFAYPTLKGFQ